MSTSLAGSAVVLQYTDCGIVRLQNQPAMLAGYLNVNEENLAAWKVDDPKEAVELDIAALRAAPALPRGLRITGLVYDVATGQTETVVAPTG